jgi:hypothetical protein
MAGGWYQNEGRTMGLAVATPSGNFPGGKVEGGFNSDYMWRNRNFHLGSSESLDGISSKALVWFCYGRPMEQRTGVLPKHAGPEIAKGAGTR